MGKLSAFYGRLTHRTAMYNSDNRLEFTHTQNSEMSDTFIALDDTSKATEKEETVDYFEKLVENSILRQCLNDIGVSGDQSDSSNRVEEDLEEMLQIMILKDLDLVGKAIQLERGHQEPPSFAEEIPEDKLSTIQEEEPGQIVQGTENLLHSLNNPGSFSHKQNELMEIITQTSRIINDLQDFRDSTIAPQENRAS